MTRLHCVACDAYFDSDGERHICPVRYTKVANYYVRRPAQAERVPETWGEAIRQNWPEIVVGVLILLSFWIGLPWLAGMVRP